MKFNKIALIIIFTTITQSVFAAKMTVYNNTGADVIAAISDTKNNYPPQIIPTGKQAPFDSGIHPFVKIQWVQKNNPKIHYFCDIPSTRIMLTGFVILEKDGLLKSNFTERGASPSTKVTKNASVSVR